MRAGHGAAERHHVVVALAARQPHPEHVHRRADVLDRRSRRARGSSSGGRRRPPPARRRCAARPRASWPTTPVTRSPSRIRSVASACIIRLEARERLRLLDQEVQEIPLRHQRDELRRQRQAAEVGRVDGVVADLGGEPLQLLVRALQEVVQQAELAHHLQRRRMHGVAPEIPQEIGVLLKHHDIDAGPRQQVAQHHAGRPAAGDAAGGAQLRSQVGVRLREVAAHIVGDAVLEAGELAVVAGARAAARAWPR